MRLLRSALLMRQISAPVVGSSSMSKPSSLSPACPRRSGARQRAAAPACSSALVAALGEVEGTRQLIVHLLRQVGQQIAQIGQRQAVDAHAQVVGLEDAHGRLVVALG